MSLFFNKLNERDAEAFHEVYRSPAVFTAILSINCRVWADGFTTKSADGTKFYGEDD